MNLPVEAAQASYFPSGLRRERETRAFGPSAFEKRVMTPGNRRFVRTALAILGLMALATATVWIVLFMFVRPARGDTVDHLTRSLFQG
jgi:hypothetical protein